VHQLMLKARTSKSIYRDRQLHTALPGQATCQRPADIRWTH
jgi:hypothetical protein